MKSFPLLTRILAHIDVHGAQLVPNYAEGSRRVPPCPTSAMGAAIALGPSLVGPAATGGATLCINCDNQAIQFDLCGPCLREAFEEAEIDCLHCGRVVTQCGCP